MTLAALLEELKEVDPKLYDDISHLELIGWQQPRNQAMDHLQGSIQRACERRGDWEVSVWWKDNKWVALIRLPGGYTDPHKVFAEESDSAAEALLAAYIAAVKEAKR
jgi:hypothetical protein